MGTTCSKTQHHIPENMYHQFPNTRTQCTMTGVQGKSGHFPATFKYSLMNFQIHMNAL